MSAPASCRPAPSETGSGSPIATACTWPRRCAPAGVRARLPSLFGELNLHRVEAACIPSNAPSIRVLQKCGFSREGLARRYLCINGVWQDHLLFGLLHEDFRG